MAQIHKATKEISRGVPSFHLPRKNPKPLNPKSETPESQNPKSLNPEMFVVCVELRAWRCHLHKEYLYLKPSCLYELGYVVVSQNKGTPI